MNKKAVNVYRLSVNEFEIEAAIFSLQTLSMLQPLQPDAAILLTKLQVYATKNRLGASTPSYVQTGRVQSSINVDALSQMAVNMNAPVPMVERRAENIIHCTAEEKLDAEFAAADHKIATGEDKDWKEFLKKPDSSKGESPTNN